jgi:hypothetical protein
VGLQVLCASILALLLGLAALLAGYRLFLLLLPIWGFFAGFFIGATVITLLLGDGFLVTVTGWVVGFILGLIFAILSYLFYFIGVAIVAGSIGYALGAGLIYAIIPDANLIAFVVGLISAIIVAGITLVLNLQKWVILTITAVGGSTAILTSILLFFGRIELTDLGTNPVQPVIQDSWFWFIFWILLAAIGIAAQSATTQAYVLEAPDSGRAW